MSRVISGVTGGSEDALYTAQALTRPPPGWEAYPDDSSPTIDTTTEDLPSTAVPRSTAVNRSASRSALATKSPSKARSYKPFTHEDCQESPEPYKEARLANCYLD
ncbi:hypothetical protein KCU65_g3652, partial [Aureobasidium melanogenum]